MIHKFMKALVTTITYAALPLCISTPALSTPLVQTYAVSLTDFGAASTFSIQFSNQIALPGILPGLTQTTVSVLGAYADGGRDGASITPTIPGQLVQVNLGGGSTVASAGAAASFSADGGTAGDIQITPFAVTDFGAPSNFNVTSSLGIPSVTGNTTSQGAVGGGVVDGGINGATINGQHPGSGIALFQAINAAPVGSYELATSPADETSPFLSTGSQAIPCTGADSCDTLQTILSFNLSGGMDAAAILARQEFGGDPIVGTVLSTYGIEAGSGMFDCAIIGSCTTLNTRLDFMGSGGGDVMAFAIRVAVDTIPENTIPEPGTLALFGLGLLGLGFTARRRKAA